MRPALRKVSGSRRTRGAAVVELALVFPLLLALVWYGQFFVELVRAKLKVQEASRYAAWETTSFVLTDVGGTAGGRHDAAFERARRELQEEVGRRYADLDSVEELSAAGGPIGYSGVKLALTDEDAGAEDVALDLTGASGASGPAASAALGGVKGGAVWLAQRWGFDRKGRVQAEVTVRVENHLLPRDFLNGKGGFFGVDLWGGRDLSSLSLKNRFTLVASGWDLPDGADAQMGKFRAGQHRGGSEHGLHRQVDRMVFLGIDRTWASVPGVESLRSVLGVGAPDPFGAFVVSHNYGLEPENRALRGCTTAGGQGDPGHPAQDGLNNLRKFATLDHSRRACFDTAPFRDQAAYESSQYVKMFRARGPYFMGCQQPMADDPTEAGAPASSVGDHNDLKVDCQRS